MKYTVKMAPQAKDQMREIISYVSYQLQSPDTAVKLFDIFERKIDSLSELPNRIALTEDMPWHDYGVRKMLVKNYFIYFWIDEQQKIVHVISIMYSKRNQREHLSELNIVIET
ncbi:MAG: type II toxin-antitoxin system RelE/ParE family toxin [Faecalibacterium sp.]|nr:type II toxin-antitoxin system RelE/ParE family toxin [Ruminococcus sp.]MCM1392715.1 type II toxin-antitoxin system RelE/ParE family toxin [Ruminococcus sp.]MCM1485291.1 type II toxin-antitoxin system RelE/ParE family toxin [Faecalibacterium sp.]